MGSNNEFSFKLIIMALVITVMLSMFINIFIPQQEEGVNTNELLDGYFQMTGTAPASESIWALKGIYTPYAGSTYGYTDDGWLYGSSVEKYTPTQYDVGNFKYTVKKDSEGLFRYYTPEVKDPGDEGTAEEKAAYAQYIKYVNKEEPLTVYGNHYLGDLYTDIAFDINYKSNIFFTENNKHTDDNGRFWYQYTGYRYSFSPLKNYTSLDKNKEPVEVIANTTSLSLIWYQYYYQSGVSGQLVVSGSSQGVAYITAEQIVQAFNSTTSAAKFTMAFNGVDMNVYVKIDPYHLAQGVSIEDCYNGGFWSVMVTSLATDTNAYENTNYALNIDNVLETIWNIFTFNYSDYGIEGWAGVICTMLICIPFYAAILVFALEYKWVAILAGIMAAIQGLGTLFGTGLF